jgi:uncharacterized membrane protein HdeD (DUF308 family)
MLIMMLLASAFTLTFVMFLMLCAGILATVQNLSQEESQDTGGRWPRLRMIMALLFSDE